MYLSPGDGIGIRVGLRNQILGVRVSSGAPNRKAKTFCQFTQKVCDGYNYGASPDVLSVSTLEIRLKFVMPQILGSKVFMDARWLVTPKEGDRYPLGPPVLLL